MLIIPLRDDLSLYEYSLFRSIRSDTCREETISRPTVLLSIRIHLHISDPYPTITIACIQRHLEITLLRPTDIGRSQQFKTFVRNLPPDACRLWSVSVTYDVNIFFKYIWEYFVGPLMSVSCRCRCVWCEWPLGRCSPGAHRSGSQQLCS
jgi:hypothetical protein